MLSNSLHNRHTHANMNSNAKLLLINEVGKNILIEVPGIIGLICKMLNIHTVMWKSIKLEGIV